MSLSPHATLTLIFLLCLSACASPPPPRSPAPAIDEASWLTGLAWISADRSIQLTNEEFDDRSRSLMESLAAGETVSTESELLILLRVRPDAWPLWLELAELRAAQGFDPEGVVEAATACLERYPEQLQCRTLVGLGYFELGELDKAEEIFGAILAEDPRRPVALETSLQIAMSRGDHDLSAELASRLVAMPERWEIRWLLALATAEENRGRLEVARQHFEDVAGRHRDRLTGLSFLHAFYERVGDTQEARRAAAELDRLRQARSAPRRRMDPL